MIKLYQFRRTWGIPNQSHFCCKVETYLRFAGLDYEMEATLPTVSPKGKLPYIEDGGRTVADSDFIIRYLKETYGDPLDVDLTAEQKATGVAIQRICEDHLFWATMYTRWNYTDENWAEIKDAIFHAVPFPSWVQPMLEVFFRWQIRRQIFGHGLGRHQPEEVFQLARDDLDALSTILAEKPYFLGYTASSVDACVFGFLINTLGCPIESPIKDYALSKPNLVAFCDRVMSNYYSELSKEDKSGDLPEFSVSDYLKTARVSLGLIF
ncbi:MAG: glutathione S-transferase [Gammaproteobacteria bacterium]|nr:MAG: glutathione S-transferase [Gammaproteobacteria bacterium]